MLKKRTLKILIVLFLTVIFIYWLSVSEVESIGKLEIKIWSDRQTYFSSQSIAIYYKIINVGDEPIAMIFRSLKGCFNIKDKQGRVYPNTVLDSYAACSDTVMPGDSLQGSEGIDDRYNIVSAGEYTCYLESPNWGRVPPAQSNTLTIKVENPTGDEKKSLDLYLEAEKLHWCKDKDTQKRKLGFSKYLEVAEKYPHSVYAPQALYSASLVYMFSDNNEDKKRLIPVYKKLIENYPDSSPLALAFSGLVDVYTDLKDKKGATETMKELIAKHPNTKISERAEFWLRQIEKWEFK